MSGEETLLRLADFAQDSKRLDAESFRAKHGDAFLLHYGPLGALRRPSRPQKTVVSRQVLGAKATPLLSMQHDFLVFPVVSTGRSPYPSLITVGRTRNNDIYIPDLSISKFHAYFKADNDRYLLQDGESRNGTTVDGKLVPRAKKGDAVEVGEGQEVRFGNVRLRFMRASGFRDLLKKTAR